MSIRIKSGRSDAADANAASPSQASSMSKLAARFAGCPRGPRPPKCACSCVRHLFFHDHRKRDGKRPIRAPAWTSGKCSLRVAHPYMSAYPSDSVIRRCLLNVRFSNRPFGVKHFQTVQPRPHPGPGVALCVFACAHVHAAGRSASGLRTLAENAYRRQAAAGQALACGDWGRAGHTGALPMQRVHSCRSLQMNVKNTGNSEPLVAP
jgi:hypothetical protein